MEEIDYFSKHKYDVWKKLITSVNINIMLFK